MRTHHARTPFHFLRAAVVAAGIVTLAACAHVLGGGQLPAPGIVLAVLALTGLAAAAATRFKLRFPAMTAILGAGQIVLHEVFSALSGVVTATASGNSRLHHVGTGAGTVAFPAVHVDSEHLHPLDSPAAALMLVAHTMATMVAALLLSKGEAALWELAAWLRPLVRLPEAVTPDAVTAPAVPGQRAAATPPPWRNLRQDSRRGPPSAVVLP